MAARLRTFAIAALVVVFIALRVSLATYRNSTSSMEPAVRAGGWVVAARWPQPRRGDVIVFDYPSTPRTRFIKRVVALPGETVEIRDKRLFINGRKLDEPYAQHRDPQLFPRDPKLPEPYRSRDQFGPYPIAPDSYFVLGDNRDSSSDSRYLGTVPRNFVLGIVVWPTSARRPK